MRTTSRNARERAKVWGAVLLVLIPAAARATTMETIFTLSDDMRTATRYFSNRDNQPIDHAFIFTTDFNRSLITYARPAGYSWTTNDQGSVVLVFPNSQSYAYLQRLPNNSEFLTRAKDNNPNRYVLNVDGAGCTTEGCTVDETIISAIIPSRFKVLDYGAVLVDGTYLPKEQAQWKIVDGTYTFYRNNIRGAIAQFYLEDAASYGYTRISESFKQNREIEVKNDGNRIRIVMPMEKLFAPGSAEMQKVGLEWIKTLSTLVVDINYVELRVEGHTDNIAIAKRTKHGYSNNWELSSARSSNIVQFLVQQGLPVQKVAAVGYADSRPIASNDTESGRARNRRIEFTIVTYEPVERAPVANAPARNDRAPRGPAAVDAPSTGKELAAAEKAVLGEEPSRPEAAERRAIESAIDSGFVRWSSAWLTDTYEPGSVRISKLDEQGGTAQVGGTISFARSNRRFTIPFGAVLKKAGDDYSLAKLCYDDTTTGTRDCDR